ncbi:CYTH domain-containing protein [Marinobacter pelagius]|uniref:CYTH domain-containing protein n=1 Tax=Marinobacter pelagius TaxID=379482 RepID=A0A366GNN0_9GAMM|nr:CYTH domain-containing protein [Marinobacter pelagius]RBP29113.1 CYTH domain-containing protein [Marinobacter pelagius]
MAEELEIKLTVSEADQQKVQAWLSNDATAEYVGEKSLINRYFDTPAAALNHQKAALRVRQAGDKYIQTLKTRGEFVNGAHRRQEWEWPLPGPDLSLGLLADTPLADRINLAELEVVFETNFQRQVWMIRREDAEVEVALDSGTVASRGRTEPLNEVEFELKSGNPAILMSLARELAEQIPVFLNLVSKAEQGYYLAGLYEPRAEPEAGALSVTGFLYQVSLAWLQGSGWKAGGNDLSKVEQAAGKAGAETELKGVLEALDQGAAVRELVRSPELGQLQLQLAAA